MLAAWEKLRAIDDRTSPLQPVQASESPAVMPSEVSNLLFPNATNFMMTTMNSVIEELFNETFGLFEQTNDFVQYVKGQRQKRYTVRKEVDSVLRCVDYLSSSGGSGEWANVKKLCASGHVLQATGMLAAGNTVDFLSKQMKNIKEAMEPVVELKELIAVDLPLHRMNEFRFYKEEISKLVEGEKRLADAQAVIKVSSITT